MYNTTPQHILLHLHIFKNAGTTFDRALFKLFHENMLSYDTNNPGGRINIAELEKLQSSHPNAKVITSHQVGLPVPVYSDVIFHPVFFLRNPIERIQSCYHFEKDVQKLFQDNVTMEMYVKRNLNNPRINACFGIQVATIADNRYLKNWKRNDITNDVVNSALHNMQTSRSFGLVDRFDESFELICKQLSRFFPELNHNIKPSQHNVSQASKNIEDKTKYVKESLSRTTFSKMQEALSAEILLYETAQKVFEHRYRKYMPK